jgi:alkyl sulfatase BDS1-like metallo-beta-lactamase superfamily hydrolase
LGTYRGVYQRYLGFYDGHPANLDPLPPADLARRYVDAMGGAAAILANTQTAYQAGDYRWVAELLKQLVFADPANAAARELQAKAFEQLAYQAESPCGVTSICAAPRSCGNGRPSITRDRARAG